MIILGGGDTGADCLGTALRQGCKSVKQFELLPSRRRRVGDESTQATSRRGRTGR